MPLNPALTVVIEYVLRWRLELEADDSYNLTRI